MLARYDAVKSLDQAADRFDKLARHQLTLHLHTGQILRDQEELSNPNLTPTKRLLITKRFRNQPNPGKWAGDAQGELARDASDLIRQVVDLRKSLPAEQKERVGVMEKLAAEFRLQENLSIAAEPLGLPTYAAGRLEKYRVANDIQFKAAAELQELARALRLPGDKLAVLREARERVDLAIAKQES